MSADASRPRLGTGRRGRATLGAHLDALADAEVPTLPRLLAPPMPPSPYVGEAAFMGLITDLAGRFHWRHYHPLDSRGDDAGWPDLVLARPVVTHPDGHRLPARGLLVETKTVRGQLRAEQLAWGRLLLAVGWDWRVWRPGSWPEIIETLTSQKG